MSRPRHRYATAHELGQFVYESGARRPGPAHPDALRRGLQVHARLQAAHMGHRVRAERPFPWDCVAVGASLLLVLGVLLWTH